jgi:hypothetical protein
MEIFQQKHHIRQTKISPITALVIVSAPLARKPEHCMARRFEAVSYQTLRRHRLGRSRQSIRMDANRFHSMRFETIHHGTVHAAGERDSE